MADFGSIREFFSNMRTFRKVGKANAVEVIYFDASHRIRSYPGSYDSDTDTVLILPLQKRVFLKGNGMYLNKKGRNTIIASHNHACSLKPDDLTQDYLTSSDVETILKSGILNQVLKPNITLGIIGFICGMAFTGIAGAVLLGVSIL